MAILSDYSCIGSSGLDLSAAVQREIGLVSGLDWRYAKRY